MTEALWDERRRRLSVKGVEAEVRALVTIRNVASGEILGTTSAGSNGAWKFSARLESDDVPCHVRAEINGAFAERTVANAPEGCGHDDDDDSEPDDGSDTSPDDDTTDSDDTHETDSEDHRDDSEAEVDD